MFYSKKYLFIQLWRYCLGFSRWKDCVWEYTWRKTRSCFPQEIARGTFGHRIFSIYHVTPTLFQSHHVQLPFFERKTKTITTMCIFSFVGPFWVAPFRLFFWPNRPLEFKGVLFSLWLQKKCMLFFFICMYVNLLAVPCHLVTVKQVDLFYRRKRTKWPFFCFFISN